MQRDAANSRQHASDARRHFRGKEMKCGSRTQGIGSQYWGMIFPLGGIHPDAEASAGNHQVRQPLQGQTSMPCQHDNVADGWSSAIDKVALTGVT